MRVPPRFYGTSCSVVNAAAVGVILIQAMSLFPGERRLLNSKKTKKTGEEGGVNSTSAKNESEEDQDVRKGFSLPFDVYKIMEDTAIDMNEGGYDFLSGFGFINAFDAVEMVVQKARKGTKSKKASKKSGRIESVSTECPVESFLGPIGS